MSPSWFAQILPCTNGTKLFEPFDIALYEEKGKEFMPTEKEAIRWHQ